MNNIKVIESRTYRQIRLKHADSLNNLRCEICNKRLQVKAAKLDHDHVTHHLRGILCNRCNLALGQVKDDRILLTKMITYIRKYRESERNKYKG